MTDELKSIWSQQIDAADYDAHMAAVGQAQANADLIATLLRERPAASGAHILIAGAGTGQMFDFTSPATLAAWHVTFTDINARFLVKLRERLDAMPHSLRFETNVDDLEASQLRGEFALAIAVLVLEHIDWRRGVASLCRLASRVLIVMQQNPPNFDQASRPLRGSLGALHAVKNPLLHRIELEQEFAKHDFGLVHHTEREVLDAKRMIGLEFQRH